MEEITFKCETITPMFMAGANGKTPELRAPSIKGAMRFWWRAMHGNLGLKELKEKEAEIFGGSGEKEGRSNVIIRITKSLEYGGRYKEFPVPHNKSFKIPAFMSRKKFDLILKLHNNIKSEKQITLISIT